MPVSLPIVQSGAAPLRSLGLRSGELHVRADAETILIYCRARLPWYMVPEELHLRPELPRTSTNTIVLLEAVGS